MQMEADGMEHFQMHWMRGEPVIVRNVLEKSSGLSWDPMVMWRAFIGAKKVLKEEAHKVKAIDCFDWVEVRFCIFVRSLHCYFQFCLPATFSSQEDPFIMMFYWFYSTFVHNVTARLDGKLENVTLSLDSNILLNSRELMFKFWSFEPDLFTCDKLKNKD